MTAPGSLDSGPDNRLPVRASRTAALGDRATDQAAGRDLKAFLTPLSHQPPSLWRQPSSPLLCDRPPQREIRFLSLHCWTHHRRHGIRPVRLNMREGAAAAVLTRWTAVADIRGHGHHLQLLCAEH